MMLKRFKGDTQNRSCDGVPATTSLVHPVDVAFNATFKAATDTMATARLHVQEHLDEYSMCTEKSMRVL